VSSIGWVGVDPTQPTVRRPRSPRARSRARVRGLSRLAAAILLLAIGILLGLALGDRPRDPARITTVRDVRQVTVTETVAERTTTVVVTAPAP
jgi:hypothetical protein